MVFDISDEIMCDSGLRTWSCSAGLGSYPRRSSDGGRVHGSLARTRATFQSFRLVAGRYPRTQFPPRDIGNPDLRHVGQALVLGRYEEGRLAGKANGSYAANGTGCGYFNHSLAIRYDGLL